jgi:hypothetical protein
MILAGETEERGEKPVPVPLYLPQIPHGLNRERTRASAVRDRRLTAWDMARPTNKVNKASSNKPIKSESQDTCTWFPPLTIRLEHQIRLSWIKRIFLQNTWIFKLMDNEAKTYMSCIWVLSAIELQFVFLSPQLPHENGEAGRQAFSFLK